MYELFYKYLILNNKASLPGIGSFLIEQIPATMDFENKKINPPQQRISMQNAVVESEVNTLQNYLSQELNISSADANDKLLSFSNQIQDNITVNGSIEIPGIGKVAKNFNGTFGLDKGDTNTTTNQVLPELWINNSQAANTNFMEVYSDITPSIIRRENYTEKNDVVITKETEDYWWVWAIVLAIMGLGALLYYYI